MRDIAVFLIIFGSLPFIFKRPAIGVMVYTWLSLMNPHRLTYGAAYDFPFAALIAVATALSLVLSKQPKGFPRTPVTILLLVFTAWMTFTSFFALEPTLVWREWDRVMKTMFMVFISLMALNTEEDLKRYVWVVALSLGIYGLKGGIFVLLSGGNFKVYGPDGSYIAENNSMALALVTILFARRLGGRRRDARLALAEKQKQRCDGHRGDCHGRAGRIDHAAAMVRPHGLDQRVQGGRLGNGTHQRLVFCV
jgi:putative inorganic carbon (HCO3(-)) transporter